jgi:hypothetical protein
MTIFLFSLLFFPLCLPDLVKIMTKTNSARKNFLPSITSTTSTAACWYAQGAVLRMGGPSQICATVQIRRSGRGRTAYY